MKAIMMTVRLWWFYLTYKDIKKAEIRKRFAKNFKGKIYECVSKTNWKKDLMKIPAEEREFFKQFVGKVGLCFECDKVEKIHSYLEPEQWYMTSDLGGSGLLQKSCLSFEELDNYLLSGEGYAIHITNLEIFDKPREIGEFCKVGYENEKQKIKSNSKLPLFGEVTLNHIESEYQLTRAPESWCYVEI